MQITSKVTSFPAQTALTKILFYTTKASPFSSIFYLKYFGKVDTGKFITRLMVLVVVSEVFWSLG